MKFKRSSKAHSATQTKPLSSNIIDETNKLNEEIPFDVLVKAKEDDLKDQSSLSNITNANIPFCLDSAKENLDSPSRMTKHAWHKRKCSFSANTKHEKRRALNLLSPNMRLSSEMKSSIPDSACEHTGYKKQHYSRPLSPSRKKKSSIKPTLCRRTYVLEQHSSESHLKFHKIPIPTHEDIIEFFRLALKQTESHQFQLANIAKIDLLSLEDVLLPSVCREHLEAIKESERHAKHSASLRYKELNMLIPKLHARYRQSDLDQALSITKAEFVERDSRVIIFQKCRKMIKQYRNAARKIVHVERLAQEKVDKRKDCGKEKFEAQPLKVKPSLSVQRRWEQVRQSARIKQQLIVEQKNRYTGNKELWRQVAYLMTVHARLEKEELEWDSAIETLDKKKSNLEILPETKSYLALGKQNDSSYYISNNSFDLLETQGVLDAVSQVVNNILMDIDHVNEKFVDIVSDAHGCIASRGKLYDKYTLEHQFRGLKGVDHPRELILHIVSSSRNHAS